MCEIFNTSDSLIASDARQLYTLLNRRVIGNMFNLNVSYILGGEAGGR